MTFAQPELLWIAVVLPLVLIGGVYGYAHRRRRVARRWGDSELVQRLTGGDLSRLPVARLVLMGLTGAALGLAAAGPQWGLREVETSTRSLDMVIAFDVSRSMYAEDVSPSRLALGRLFAQRLMRALVGDRIGLVAFAGRAYTLTPPTVDPGALQLYLDALDPEIVSQGGSSLSTAIRQSSDLVRGERETGRDRVVIVISDGEAHEDREDVLAAADRAAREGVVIHTVGVGTPDGARIPLPPVQADQMPRYQYGPGGNLVISRLDEALMREVAERTGGRFIRLDRAEESGELLESLREMSREEGAGGTRMEPRQRYTWFVAFALLCLAIDLLWSGRRSVAARSGSPIVPGTASQRSSRRLE